MTEREEFRGVVEAAREYQAILAKRESDWLAFQKLRIALLMVTGKHTHFYVDDYVYAATEDGVRMTPCSEIIHLTGESDER